MTGQNVTARLILATLLAAFFATGCFTTQLAVPHRQSVTLLPENAPASYHKEWKNWYALWGMYPIADTQPEVIIRDEKLRPCGSEPRTRSRMPSSRSSSGRSRSCPDPSPSTEIADEE